VVRRSAEGSVVGTAVLYTFGSYVIFIPLPTPSAKTVEILREKTDFDNVLQHDGHATFYINIISGSGYARAGIRGKIYLRYHLRYLSSSIFII
jgi:hypothetical protein